MFIIIASIYQKVCGLPCWSNQIYTYNTVDFLLVGAYGVLVLCSGASGYTAALERKKLERSL